MTMNYFDGVLKTVVYRDYRHEGAIAIAGFPGMGLVGKTVAEYLIRTLNAEHVASIYYTRFPAHLLVKPDATAHINRVDIYFAKRNSIPIFIVSSDAQPLHDADQNALSFYIVSELYKRGVRELIAAAAFVTEPFVEHRRVFVTGTSERIVNKYVKYGAEPLKEGVITGMNGVIVGWAHVLSIDAVCMLGETWRSIVELNYVDYGAAKSILQVLNAVFDLGLDLRDLDENAKRVEEEVRKLFSYVATPSARERRETDRDRSVYYIT